MKQQTFIYKLLGSGWLSLGLICLALVGFQLGGMDWSRHVERALSGNAAVLWQTFYHPLMTLVLPVWGGLCIVLGWHLVRLVNWAQQLGQAMHLLLAIYLVAALIVGFNVAPESQGFLALGILLLTADLGLAYPLRGRLAGEVFSHLPLRTAPIVSRRCEFCGGALDIRTGHCVDCQPAVQADALSADGERARPALVVQLVSLDDGAVYALSAQQPTLVGRELACNDINLTNPTVSRQHARIEYDVQNSHYLLIAMQDTNGTFINDKLVRQRILRDGDQVRFGRARFRFQVVSGVENSEKQRRTIP